MLWLLWLARGSWTQSTRRRSSTRCRDTPELIRRLLNGCRRYRVHADSPSVKLKANRTSVTGVGEFPAPHHTANTAAMRWRSAW
ncbi:hypothetical protein DPEC_G00371470 [Dallia pectoralis]|nr:hypothetical protein DPEC_G00371470 [Dallia pectoralis]